MKAVKCDICGKILDAKKGSTFFEIHKLYKANSFEERTDEVENDICYDCYNKLIKSHICENLYENNMIPNEVLKKCLTEDDHIIGPPKIVNGIGM